MNDTRYSDLKIEQLLLGEIAESEAERMKADPSVVERIAELKQSNMEILNRHPADQVARSIVSRLEDTHGDNVDRSAVDAGHDGRRATEKQPGGDSATVSAGKTGILPFRSPHMRGIALAAAAAIVLFLGVFSIIQTRSGSIGDLTSTSTGKPENAGPIRMKGLEPSINIYRKSGSDVEKLEPMSVVQENDRLQIAYIAAGNKYGAIISVDGRGAVTRHFPYSDFDEPILSSDGEVALRYSYQLDDAPAYERFFFLTSEREFPTDIALRAAREFAQSTEGSARAAARGGLSLPDYIEQYSVTLKKGVSR